MPTFSERAGDAAREPDANHAEEMCRVFRESRKEGNPEEWAMEDAIRALDLLRRASPTRSDLYMPGYEDGWKAAIDHGAASRGPVAPPSEEAAQLIRYYKKHQNLLRPWESLSEHERGVSVTCDNLERLVLERAVAGGSPPDELGQIKAAILAICDEPEDEEYPYVILGESGSPIVEATTISEAVAQIIACWNAVELKLDSLGGAGSREATPDSRQRNADKGGDIRPDESPVHLTPRTPSDGPSDYTRGFEAGYRAWAVDFPSGGPAHG